MSARNTIESGYVPSSGFLDKNELLEYIEEDEIFSLVLGYKPQEFQYICNPLRTDNTPGAYFEVNPYTDRLELIDWGHSPSHIDSFLFVQKFYNLPNFYQTLIFIQDNLLFNKQEIKKIDKEEKQRKILEKKDKFQIYIKPRNFISSLDGPVWNKFGIMPNHLTEDKVLAVTEYAFQNAKSNGPFNAITPTYAFTDFEDGRKKLYFPYKKDRRYITDCVSNDIGGLNFFNKHATKCIINKGYKEYRISRNVGINNFWLQSEGMIPDDILLASLLENMDEVIVFFDNDSVGIEKGKILTDHINNLFGKKLAHQYYLPLEKGKDLANLRELLLYDEAVKEFMFKEICK